MPQRQNQTKDTLTIESNLTGRIYDNDVYENLRQVNGKLYAEREAKVFPLEKLVSLGLVTPQKYTLDERQDSISRQLHAKCDTMKLQLAQIRHQPPQPITLQKQQKRQENVTLVKELSRKADINENQNSTNVKLTLLLGQQTHPFGYTRFASNDHRNFTFKVYDEEKEKLRANFFQSDPLEDETPFGSIPLKFNIYHRLVAQNQKKYENYEERMTRGNTLTPLSSHEYLNKEERKKYRRRPGPDTPLCSNGIRCLFYTFSNDPEIQYIGAAFFTPKQLERMEDNKKNKSTMRGLCIDCLEASWTLDVMENIAKERSAQVPINHYSVIVGEGEYSAECMLATVFGDVITGIVGDVPKYDAKNRCKSTMVIRDIQTGITTTESYIAECGMDF
jgi:hypothetical protein